MGGMLVVQILDQDSRFLVIPIPPFVGEVKVEVRVALTGVAAFSSPGFPNVPKVGEGIQRGVLEGVVLRDALDSIIILDVGTWIHLLNFRKAALLGHFDDLSVVTLLLGGPIEGHGPKVGPIVFLLAVVNGLLNRSTTDFDVGTREVRLHLGEANLVLVVDVALEVLGSTLTFLCTKDVVLDLVSDIVDVINIIFSRVIDGKAIAFRRGAGVLRDPAWHLASGGAKGNTDFSPLLP